MNKIYFLSGIAGVKAGSVLLLESGPWKVIRIEGRGKFRHAILKAIKGATK